MNKRTKKTFITLALLVFGIGAAVAISYATVNGWDDPQSAAPNGNVSSVVTQLSDSQVKTGDLSVGPFLATGYGYFGQDVFFSSILTGGTTAQSTFKFGGTDHNGTPWPVDTHIQGSLQTRDALTSSSLANQSQTKICSDKTTGKIVLCDSSGNGGGSIAGTGTAKVAPLGGGITGRILGVKDATSGQTAVATTGSFPVNPGQSTTFTLGSGVITLVVSVDGNAGSIKTFDSMGDQECQNYGFAGDYTFSNFATSTNPYTITLVPGSC